MIQRTVTCRTEECVNGGQPITFVCAPAVICGGCGVVIEDVVTA